MISLFIVLHIELKIGVTIVSNKTFGNRLYPEQAVSAATTYANCECEIGHLK